MADAAEHQPRQVGLALTHVGIARQVPAVVQLDLALHPDRAVPHRSEAPLSAPTFK